MNFNNITIGADPEVFLYNIKERKYITAEGIIEGTKEHPKRITDIGHNVQLDNVMLEFNVPPAKSSNQLYNDIQFILYYAGTKLPKDVVVSIIPSAIFEEDQLITETSQLFGCDPDFNAWTEQVNPKPSTEETGGLRTAGGHVHIGYDDPADAAKGVELIKALDLFLGIPSLFLDTDTERRKQYGNAGSFRIKPYGVEYRTLSNFWIKSPNKINWLFNGIKEAMIFLKTKKLTKDDGKFICKAINENDLMLAETIMKSNKVRPPSRKAKGYKVVELV